MLTRSFYMLLGDTTGMMLSNVPTKTKDVKGNDLNNYEMRMGGGSSYQYIFSQNNWSLAKIILGSGTTKPKNTDYKLEAEITEGYDISSLTKRYVSGEEKDYLKISGFVTNTGTENLTFSEAGLLGCITINGQTYILLAREVYDTPITIKPGESGAVSVNIL